MAALDGAQRVERVDDRDAEVARGLGRREARHPEVRVHHVRRLGGPALAQVARERVHVREQLVLGELGRRPGVDVVDDHAAGEGHLARAPRVVAPGVDDDLVAAAAERRRQLGDVDVLPAGVDAAEHRQRARVLGHHRDPHLTATSSSTPSQSARKRSSP
jgi:hypothetical protein